MSTNIATKYSYENGSKDQWGAFVTLAIGLQENRKLGNSCSLSYSADFGGRASSLKTTSTLNLNLQTKLSYNISENSKLT